MGIFFVQDHSMKKYLSKYSNGKQVSAAQYITEIVCEHKAKVDGKDLYYRFWTNIEWLKFYKDQIASSNKLLKKYTDTAIIRALNNPKAAKIYSLRSPYLPSIIEQEQKLLEQENTQLSIKLDRKDKVSYQHNTIKKNIISKLKDLE